MSFAERLIRFMKEFGYRPSEFGRAIVNDPNFVSRIVRGQRSPTEKTMAKVEQWMALGPEVHAWEKRHPSEVANLSLAQRSGRWSTAAIVWTEREDQEIRRMLAQGAGWAMIGRTLGVSARSARRRATEIGAAPPPKARRRHDPL